MGNERRKSAWDVASQFLGEPIEGDEPNTPHRASLHIYCVLEWLERKGLLLPSGQTWLADQSEEPKCQVGLYRRDVTPQAAEFLDTCYERWFNSRGIFIGLFSDEYAEWEFEQLDDLWDEWTGVKPEKQYREFKRLFAEANDFDLCNGIFLLIGDRFHHCIEADKYNETERVVMITWSAMGIIDNGGFEYLFSSDFDGDPGFRLTFGVFETLGVERAVSAFREALALFPDSVPDPDLETRMHRYKQVPEETRESINRKFWSAGWDNEIVTRLAAYIREHQTELNYWEHQ